MDPTYIYWNRAYDPFNHNRHQATNERAIQPEQARRLSNKNYRFNYNDNEAIGSNPSQDKSKHKIDSTSPHNQQHRDRTIDSNNHLSVTYERLEYSWFELALPITILSLSILVVLLLIAWLIVRTKRRFFTSKTSNKTIDEQIDRYRIDARDDQIRMIDDDEINASVYNQNADPSSTIKNQMDGSSDNENCSSTPISPTASQPIFHYPQRQSPMTTNATPFLHDILHNPMMDNTTITTSVPIHVSISVPVSTIISQPINYSPSSYSSSPKLSEDQSPPGYRTTTIVTKPRVRKVHQKDVCTPPPPPPQPMDVRKFSFVQSHDSAHQTLPTTESHQPHQSNDWTVNESSTPPSASDSIYSYHSSLEQMSPSSVTTIPSNNPLVHGYRYKPNYSPKICSDDKENAIPVTTGTGSIGVASSHSAASSPKIQRCGDIALAQQNSPRIIDSSASSTGSRFTFSPRLLQQHSGEIITSTSGISPLMTSAGYKHGNYFRFPDVDVFTPNYKPMTPTTVVEDKIGIEIITSADDTDGVSDDLYGTEEDDDALLLLGSMRLNNGSTRNSNTSSTGSTSKTQATRRARLKSISLDSDGAKLVEENLGIPVEELVEIAALNSEVFDKTTDDNPTMDDEYQQHCANEDAVRDGTNESQCQSISDVPFQRKCHTKNKNNLSINLNIRDDSLASDEANDYDYKCNKIPTTPKTPTFTQHRQKAISLDSDPTMGSFESPWKAQQPLYAATSHINISSVSVPSTPKRQPNVRGHIQSEQDVDCNNCCHTTTLMGTSNSSTSGYLSKHQQKFKHSKGSLFAAMRQDESKNRSSFGARSKLLSNFHEKLDFGKQCSNDRPSGMCLGEMKTSQSGDYLGSNLQTLKTATLSVSNNNLKTLPEVMTLSDFGPNNKMSTSLSTTPCSTTSGVVGKSRSSIIQRRGSNHSLTLNSEQGLSVSNYSLGNLQGSNCNLAGTSCGTFSFDANSAIRNKKNLLQRRGSNTSLTLNIQGSSNSLNRFNSHSSLNISQDGGVSRQKKGLLERRNSNASLTLNIQNRGLSISNCNLRGSECSLSSMNVGNAESFDQPEVQDEQVNTQIRHQNAHHRRKFLSSENLHNFSICLKQCDSESNIHRGSVSNLKHTSPHHSHITVDGMDMVGKVDGECTNLDGDRLKASGNIREYCDCVVRNISTKPLSPQTTSEDFKIYLANIQMLQSASNVLSDQQLRNLNAVFENSYNKGQTNVLVDEKMTKSCESTSIGLATGTDDTQKMLLRNLHQEFWDLPTNYQEKPLVFGSQTKNRYKTILPNEHSRVILSAEPGLLQEPYINANFIKGPDYVSNSYIATQGPLTNTIYEYWLMIYQNVKKSSAADGTRYQKIAMLTDFIENSRQKCAIYFPTNVGETMSFVNPANPMEEIDCIDDATVNRLFDCIQNPDQHTTATDSNESSSLLPNLPNNCNYFLVKTIEIIVKNGYTIRKLCVLYLNSSQWCDESLSQRGQMEYLANHSFYCHHYWFPDWPDHRSPDDIDVLLDMSLHLLDDNDEWKRQDGNVADTIIPLPVIHCSAGIGRTGCFAAILNGLRQMRMSVLQNASTANGTGQLSVDILGIVCNLRLQRGGMVQNSEQYELIHRALCLYQKRLSCTTNEL